MTSAVLSEALRAEIRDALEAGGKPFTISVARRVYDIAISARDFLIASGNSVEEAIEQVEDTKGQMDTLDAPETPAGAALVAESFGVRMMREALALLPALIRPPNETVLAPTPFSELVPVLILARKHGMTDVAAEVEKRMFGFTLDGARPINRQVEVEVDEPVSAQLELVDALDNVEPTPEEIAATVAKLPVSVDEWAAEIREKIRVKVAADRGLLAVPVFQNEREEATFWATHDTCDYDLGDAVEVEFDPSARTRMVRTELIQPAIVEPCDGEPHND